MLGAQGARGGLYIVNGKKVVIKSAKNGINVTINKNPSQEG